MGRQGFKGINEQNYDSLSESLFPPLNSFTKPKEENEIFDDYDFSSMEGSSFTNIFSKFHKNLEKNKIDKNIFGRGNGSKKIVYDQNGNLVYSNFDSATSENQEQKDIFGNTKIVPADKVVTLNGVTSFKITKPQPQYSPSKIGYYEGKKLNKIVLNINNNGLVNFTTELFNPSAPLDYLYSTSQTLNDKIGVNGSSELSYTDVLFSLLANPTLIVNSTITSSVLNGTNTVKNQLAQPMTFVNKKLNGNVAMHPSNIALNIDTMQPQNDIVYYDIVSSLGRPFIPDGMDIIQYTILAGMGVNIAFYYKQVQLKKLLLQEAKNSVKIM